MRLHFQLRQDNYPKRKSRTTSCDLDDGRPRQSGCLYSRPATFRPCLAAGLVFCYIIVISPNNTIKTISKVCKILKNQSPFLYFCTEYRHLPPPKNRRNRSGIRSTSRSSPVPSVTAASPAHTMAYRNALNSAGIGSAGGSFPSSNVTAASPGLNQNCTNTSPLAATRSSHGPSS